MFFLWNGEMPIPQKASCLQQKKSERLALFVRQMPQQDRDFEAAGISSDYGVMCFVVL
jgi:hypothetical protein